MPVPARPANDGASDHKFAGRASPFRIALFRGGVLVESARARRDGGVKPDHIGEDGCGYVGVGSGVPCTDSGSTGAACVVTAGA